MQLEHQRDDLLDGIAKERSQVANGKLHLAFHIVETLQELLDAYHRMRAIETLQPLEVVVAVIVDRNHIALACRIDAFHPAEVDIRFVNVPIHGLQEDVDSVIIIVERAIAIVFQRTVNHHLTQLVIIAEAKSVVIDGILFLTRNGVDQIEPHGGVVGNKQLVHRHHETLRLHLDDFLALVAEMEHRLVIDTAKHIHLVAHPPSKSMFFIRFLIS